MKRIKSGAAPRTTIRAYLPPGGAGRQRKGDDLSALAGDRQGPLPALQAQVRYISASGLRDPEPVQREQRDQRMLDQ